MGGERTGSRTTRFFFMSFDGKQAIGSSHGKRKPIPVNPSNVNDNLLYM